MPTYQYRCTACGKELEAVQKFSDPALTTCPALGDQDGFGPGQIHGNRQGRVLRGSAAIRGVEK